MNGPLLQHADAVIKAALVEMYKDSKDIRNRRGNLIRRNQNIADYSVQVSGFILQQA